MLELTIYYKCQSINTVPCESLDSAKTILKEFQKDLASDEVWGEFSDKNGSLINVGTKDL